MRCGPGAAAQSARPARSTRLRFSAAADAPARARSAVGDAGQVDGVDVQVRGQPRASSAVCPVSRLTTPPGRSEVASTSASVIAGQRPLLAGDHDRRVAGHDHRGEDADQPEQAEPLRGDHADHAGRLGRGEVEVRPGDRVGAARPPGRSCPDQPAYQTQPVDRGVDRRAAPRLAAVPRPRRPRRRTGRAGPPASRPPGRGPGRGCRRCAATSRRPPRGPPPRRPWRPCARPARRWRGSRPSASDRVGPAGLRARERAADEQLVGLAHVRFARPPGQPLAVSASRYAASPCRPPSRP